jgi:hypothetical protein
VEVLPVGARNKELRVRDRKAAGRVKGSFYYYK